MIDNFSHEWRMRTPAIFRIVCTLFIALSIYVGSSPVFERFGTFAGYAYDIVGVGLIIVLSVTFKLSIRHESRPET